MVEEMERGTERAHGDSITGARLDHVIHGSNLVLTAGFAYLLKEVHQSVNIYLSAFRAGPGGLTRDAHDWSIIRCILAMQVK